MATPRVIDVGGGRAITLDDVGDPGGVPVLYLHGTPSSRLARPADDGLAAAAGVRLLAVDRPGYGGSDPLPDTEPAGPAADARWPAMLAADVTAALDGLGIRRFGVLASSGGALAAVAVAAELSDRVDALGIVSGIVPRQAFDDADVEAQARPLPVDLSAIRCPVQLWYGSDDPVTPPAFGQWYARELSGARLTIVDGAAHYLVFTHWVDILGGLVGARGRAH